MKLPGADHADLGRKLEDYVLNREHREGKHKARVFESVLGITLSNKVVLQQAILRAAVTADDVESRGDHGHGALYALRFPLRTAKAEAIVQTAWIVRRGRASRA